MGAFTNRGKRQRGTGVPRRTSHAKSGTLGHKGILGVTARLREIRGRRLPGLWTGQSLRPANQAARPLAPFFAEPPSGGAALCPLVFFKPQGGKWPLTNPKWT